MRLCSADGLARLELPPELQLHVAQADVDNCFHRMRMPTEMHRWFSLPRISAASHGGRKNWRAVFSMTTPIFPFLETLPLGFAWSLFFAQSAHEATVEEQAGLSAADRIGDFAPARRLKSGGVSHLQNVDNFAALEGQPGSLTHTKENVREAMGARGLLMREHEGAEGRSRTCWPHDQRLEGLSDCVMLCYTPPGCAVCLGWPWMLSWDMLDCFLVHRCFLSVFGRAHAFALAHNSAPAPLWLSVRRELRNAAHLLPLAFSNLRRSWSPNVWCVDAAPRGIAAMRSAWRIRQSLKLGVWRNVGDGS